MQHELWLSCLVLCCSCRGLAVTYSADIHMQQQLSHVIRQYPGQMAGHMETTSSSICFAAAQPSLKNMLGIRFKARLTRLSTEALSASLAVPPVTNRQTSVRRQQS